MGLDNVGDNELTGVSASGTAPDIRSEGSTPGGGSSGNKPGMDSAGSGKQMSGQSAGNALSQGLSGVGRVGFGMLALGRNGANATMAMFNTMLRKVAAAATTGGALCIRRCVLSEAKATEAVTLCTNPACWK